jgi:ribosomal protein S18 acetylase RimI-like enzyme
MSQHDASPQTVDLHLRPFEDADESAVVALWERCQLTRPWNDPRKDIRRKRANSPESFLVGMIDGEIVATIMFGYEGHRGSINYLGVAPEHQRKGFGRMLMQKAEEHLRAAGCPKINLNVRSANHEVIAFYRSLGYTVDEVIGLGKRLEHDQTDSVTG